MHFLQFLQLSIFTKALLFSNTMVSVGQTSIQAPQAVHFSATTLGYKILRSVTSGFISDFISDTVSCFPTDVIPGITLRTKNLLHSGHTIDLH
jgi:hypothetical protein